MVHPCSLYTTSIWLSGRRKRMTARNMVAVTMAIAMVLVLLAAKPAFSGQLVEYLPGYNGKLPFKLETGYVSVGDIEMFYYFIESQGNPKTDPLFLWSSGGPGCSAHSTLFYEIGPLEYNLTSYFEDGLVRLSYYAESWTQTASVLFVDSPVGTGFSYSTTTDGWATSDTKASEQLYEFLLKWLEENPKYLPVDTYIAGDSYAGLIVPLVTKLIVEGNDAQIQPHVNLKGYWIGSPVTDKFVKQNVLIIEAYHLGLISEEIYKMAKENCNGNYLVVDPSNTKCVLALQQYNKCIKDLNAANILDANCQYAIERRSLQDSSQESFLSPPRSPRFPCMFSQYLPSYDWANDPQVREALHIRKDTITYWIRCNYTINYTQNVESVVDIHKFLTTRNLHVFVASGDRDFNVATIATEKWIKSLNLTVEENWRPWFVDGQVAGYTEKYMKTRDVYRLVFATVKGAGHVVQLFYRGRTFYMFDRWVHGYPL